MNKITLKKELSISVGGDMPQIGSIAPQFKGVKNDLSEVHLSDFKGKKVILNVFPSIDTAVCATSVRRFNKEVAELENTVVLCISKDLPFAQGRFCGAEGIDGVETISQFRCDCFEKNYGTLMEDGPLKGLLARSVFVINKEGELVYSELVPEVTQEPDYEKVISTIKSL